MSYGIKIITLAGVSKDPPPPRTFVPRNQWVSYFDPDANGGRGRLVTVKDPHKALHFQTKEGATEYYLQTSTVKPTRADGNLNRPLTAFTVSVEALPEE